MEDEEIYQGTLEEDMDEEGRIVNEEKRREHLCANCLDRQFTAEVNGVKLCLTCLERYPNGMPF